MSCSRRRPGSRSQSPRSRRRLRWSGLHCCRTGLGGEGASGGRRMGGRMEGRMGVRMGAGWNIEWSTGWKTERGTKAERVQGSADWETNGREQHKLGGTQQNLTNGAEPSQKIPHGTEPNTEPPRRDRRHRGKERVGRNQHRTGQGGGNPSESGPKEMEPIRERPTMEGRHRNIPAGMEAAPNRVGKEPPESGRNGPGPPGAAQPKPSQNSPH